MYSIYCNLFSSLASAPIIDVLCSLKASCIHSNAGACTQSVVQEWLRIEICLALLKSVQQMNADLVVLNWHVPVYFCKGTLANQ